MTVDIQSHDDSQKLGSNEQYTENFVLYSTEYYSTYTMYCFRTINCVENMNTTMDLLLYHSCNTISFSGINNKVSVHEYDAYYTNHWR